MLKIKTKNRLGFNKVLCRIALLCFCLGFIGQLESYAQDKSGEVRLNAKQFIYSQKKDEIILYGNVRFHYKGTVLSGQRAVFNTKTQEGKMTGGVRIYRPGTTVTGDAMKVDYGRQIANLTGDVRIVTVRDITKTPANKEGMLPSGVTAMTCRKLKYNWDKNEGFATKDVTVTQKDRRVFADKAHYNGKSDIITLTGRVRFEQGAHNWVTCKKAVIDMRRETFMAMGGVTGNFLVKELKQETGKDKQPDKYPDKIVVPAPSYDKRKLPE